MKEYTQANPPQRGTGKRLWLALHAAGLNVRELHYNANCYGQGQQNGWGTWAGQLDDSTNLGTLGRSNPGTYFYAGVHKETNRCYIEQVQAPYAKRFIEPVDTPATD